jgi:hypothetical protein
MHLVKEWPEVFEDMYMNTMPVAYLEMVHLTFEDGRIWQIDVRAQLQGSAPESIAEKLLETLQEYKDEIKKIDFKIDIERLKRDITDSTKTLF